MIANVTSAAALVPVEFYIFVALLVVAILGGMGWIMEREKRVRLLKATKELEEILKSASEALQEHSEEKLARVNDMIEAWDKSYCEEVGQPLPKLNWVPAH